MKLSDIAEITAGHAFRGKITTAPQGEITVVQMRNIKDQRYIDWHGCINTELTSSHNVRLLSNGEILFMSRAESSLAIHVSNIIEGQSVLAAPYFFVIRLHDKAIEPRFITWFINQIPSQRYFQREAEGSGRKNIRKGVLGSLPITLPPVEKQRAIIQLDAVLYQEMLTLNDLLENNKQTMTSIAHSLLTDNEGTRNNA